MRLTDKIRLTITVLCISICTTLQAQVTTSSVSGTVMCEGETAIGAYVTAVHTPSGAIYRAATNGYGNYTISGMRSGGPYVIEVSYIGFKTKRFSDIFLVLGLNTVIDVQLDVDTQKLNEVVVVGMEKNNMRSDRSGVMTLLNSEQMALIPSVVRTITDMARITPQSSNASGMAIGGGNFRQSSFTVDGASFNNIFGIDETPIPGGGSPISLDAIEQMTVNLTPYDVRQSGFTGAGISAVTKSGTNQFKGSAYSYLTSSSLSGSRVADKALPTVSAHSNTYGLTLGGPILKDKLFFFVNGEIEDDVKEGPDARAGNGQPPYDNTSRRPQLTELEGLSTYLRDTYGIETGTWQDYNVKAPSYRLLARIDWNISDSHKFNVRLTRSNRKRSNPPSASRTIGSSRSSKIYGGHQNTYGINSYYSMSPEGGRYIEEFRFTSVAAELNSRFGKVDNTLRATYSYQDQPRSTDYDITKPVVEIVMSDGQGRFPSWASIGDMFTYGNYVKTKNLVITDELHFQLGNHKFFGGLQFEHTYASNGYAQAGAGYYAFEATQAEVSNGDWATVFGRAPRAFGITYGNNSSRSLVESEMSTNQWSLNLQDNMTLSDRFRLSVGARLELPCYPSLSDNFNQKLYDIDFGGHHYSTDNLPSSRLSLSPRVGFNWDILGTGRLILRGGTGLFVGRIPFVWFISAVNNSGMKQTSYFASGSAVSSLRFTTDRDDMLRQVNAQSNISVPTSPTILSSDLRMPKTWKSSLSLDTTLPGDIDFSFEGLLSRDINPVVVSNADIYWDGTSTIDLGHGDVRHQLSYYDPQHAPYILENAGGKAYYISLTAGLRKSFPFGLNIAASYTKSWAKSYTEGIGNQVTSAYNNYRASINAVNDNETGYSTYVAPDRVLLSLSYKVRTSKHSNSIFSLIYDGYQYGFLTTFGFNRYSYTFTNCVNGDPTAPGNLIYIPASREELQTWNFKDNGTVDGQTYTADMQRDDFWSYIEQDPYLSKHKGQYAERGGAKMPWHHQLDFKFTQEFHIDWGKTTHTLQLGMDILNLPNFLCKDWGVFKQITGSDLLNYDKGQYTYNLQNGKRHLTTYQNFIDAVSTYRIMFTIRYLFN